MGSVNRYLHAALLSSVVSATPALAQVNEAAPSVAPEAPAESAPSQGVSARQLVTPEPSQTECVPSCRSGFTCISGTCRSACNPACGPGELCTDAGECSSREEQRYDQTVRRHDGFYARLALGIGGLIGSRTEDYAPFDEVLRLEGDVSGIAQVGALMLGGTVAEGLVLGGGVWGANAPATTYEGDIQNLAVNRVAEAEQADVGLASVSVLGPFLAWYPDPMGGLHGEVAAGFALASINGFSELRGSDVLEIEDYEGGGWGVVLGVGYDFWIGEQWSLGVLGRVSYASVGQTSDTNTLTAFIPAIAGTVTYH
jgi:hypothetical protein